MKTNQEIFDIVAAHLLTQLTRSVSFTYDAADRKIEECRYRGDNGLKCAAGILIPDELYTPSLEGFGVGQPRVSARIPDVDESSLSLLRSLQITHDTKEPTSWERTLRRTAEFYDLVFNAEAYGLKAYETASLPID